MSPADGQRRWRQVQDLFLRARELEPERRDAFLARHAPDDPALVAEVRELLVHALSGDGRGGTAIVREDLSGTELGSYRLLRIIGEGSMGVIYEARQRWVERSVALKILRRRHDVLGAGGSAEVYERMTARFLAEAEVLGLLDHPGIVPIHTLEREGERTYFTMRLVRGADFREAIARLHAGGEPAGGWTLARALHVVLRVCETMAFAHRRGVLHRDLKPSHVLVGDFGEVYLVDWGLARLPGRRDARDLRLREEDSAHGPAEGTRVPAPLRTVEGDVIGTPAYMPPEQARGELGRLDERSDVYAVGALLYHLLAGHAPYLEPGEPDGAHPSGRTVLESVRARPPAPLEARDRAIPPALAAICRQAMQREPAERYPSMAALGDDLRAYLENRVVSAHRTDRWTAGKKWVQRNRWIAAGAGLAGLLALGWSLNVLELERRKNVALAASVAETRTQRDRAREQAAIAGATTAFLDEMFRSLHPSEAQGETVTVREALDRASRRLATFDGSVTAAAQIRGILGTAYHQLGHYEEAEPLLESAWRARCEQLGEADPATIEAGLRHGVLLRDRGRLDEARAQLEHQLELARRVHGEDARETLHARVLLAQLALDRERLDEATEEARALVDELEARPADVSDLALALEILGSARYGVDDLVGAERAFRREVEVLDAARGPEHSDALIARTNLAAVLDAAGRSGEAAALTLDLAERTAEVFGPRHRETLTVRANAGLFLCNAGRTDEGLRILAETLEAQRAVLGDTHPGVVLAIYNLAELLRRARRFDEALPLYEELQDTWGRLDPDHLDVRRACIGLADCLVAARDWSAAAGVLRALLPVQRRNAGQPLTDAAETAWQLGRCLAELGLEDELAQLRRENDDMPERAFPTDRPSSGAR